MAPLRYAAKFDPFLSLDCAPRPPPWRNPRKGRDQILPSGNLAAAVQLAHPDPEVRDEADGRPRPHPPGARPPLGLGGAADVPGRNRKDVINAVQGGRQVVHYILLETT